MYDIFGPSDSTDDDVQIAIKPKSRGKGKGKGKGKPAKKPKDEDKTLAKWNKVAILRPANISLRLDPFEGFFVFTSQSCANPDA